jgi:hypothetical protein
MRISGKILAALIILCFFLGNHFCEEKGKELSPGFVEHREFLNYQQQKVFWKVVYKKTRVLFYQDMVFWYRRGSINSPTHKWLTGREESLRWAPTLSFISFPQEKAIIFPYYIAPTMRSLVKETDVYRIVPLPERFMEKIYSGEVLITELEKQLVNVKDDGDLYSRTGDHRYKMLLRTFDQILLNYKTSKRGLERCLRNYFRVTKKILTNEELQNMPLDFTNPLLEVPGMRLDFLLNPYGERLQIEGLQVIEPPLIQKLRLERIKVFKANFKKMKCHYAFFVLPFVFFWIVVALSVHRFILIKILHIKVYTRRIFYWQLIIAIAVWIIRSLRYFFT